MNAQDAISPRSEVTLADALEQVEGRVLLTGNQALARIALMQADRDRAAGLKTAGYISGYRGSPLGGLDLALGRAAKLLKARDIVFQPGLNEELAATAIWGSQQAGLYEASPYDGVFAIWYGKGPGVDRAGDALKHGNLAGSAAAGGVVVLAGDDHLCKSSTTAHQSEPALIAAGMPILNPASVDELVDYGLHAIALSRASGCWVAMKCLTDVVDSTAAIDLSPWPPSDPPTIPGLGIRASDKPLEQERRLMADKLPAAKAYVAALGLDRVTHGRAGARVGIVTTGKSWLDVRAALDLLGLETEGEGAAEVAVYKVAMPWPLEPEGLRAFAAGCRELIVVEEKRPIIEDQIRTVLYGLADGARPVVSGKTAAPDGAALFADYGALDAATVARGLARRLADHDIRVEAPPLPLDAGDDPMARGPWFCAGCPHNGSTRVPEGSLAGAGIGCHGLAMFNDPQVTLPFTQMGGEGAHWIGRAPFVDAPHIFQNLGDGTYSHSGLLAIRAAIAAGVNITYKILFNDAVAMTGGQAHDATLSPQIIARQLLAEGVGRVVILADDVGRYASAPPPVGVELFDRSQLDVVQRDLRERAGVTALIYDQMCATELRRQRKRGLRPKAAVRVHINPQVCEGCGDCGLVSNCVAIQPLETPLGTKRRIDEASCNVDLSCLKGFCPSFMTVPAETPRFSAGASKAPKVPEPVLPEPDGVWNIQMTGVGGTGVVTIGAILGMAAHLEGKATRILDQTGMAQKNGAVASTVMIAAAGTRIPSMIPEGRADALLGFDLAGASAGKTLALLSPQRTRAIVNSRVSPPGGFTRSPDLDLSGGPLIARVQSRTCDLASIDAAGLAVEHVGEATFANMLLLGLAWQKGAIPLGHAALMRAIELNGVAVEANKAAFAWGRAQAVGDPLTASAAPDPVAYREALLKAYGGASQARAYTATIARVRAAEAAQAPRGEVTAVAAEGLFKLMTYKDEYEVARLLTDPRELARLGPGARPTFWLAPPLLARRDPTTGQPRKQAFGPWILPLLRGLAKLSGLRGTPFDLFGYTAERRAERQDIADYSAMLEAVLPKLTPANSALVAELCAQPLKLRGFGHVKAANRAQMLLGRARLLAQLAAQPAG